MRTLKLEVFEPGEKPVASQTVILDRLALEDERLAAYDKGYGAGWEDAVAAQTGDQTRLRADLARNLQTLAFTYHEARSHVLKAIEPLLLQITARLLPEIAHASLGPVVLEALLPLAEGLADAPVVLVISPPARAAVEALLDQTISLPLIVQEEPSLGEGQAYLKLGTSEVEIDLDRATADIAAALRGFFALPAKDRPNG
jgi:flagellar assembly protein FliH